MKTKNSHIAALLVGMMATFAGIGIARFAYTPIIPALVDLNWFSATEAVYLGAANLLGYLAGAIGAHPLSERFEHRRVLGVAYAAIALSFIFCFSPASFTWFFTWRLVSGFAGATLMVVGPSLTLSSTPEAKKKVIGAWVFTGIGVGVLLSATLVPILLNMGLALAWFGLGALVVCAGIVSDRASRALNRQPRAAQPVGESATVTIAQKWGVVIVLAAYAMDGVGFVPHTVFWVDYLAREVGVGQNMASLQWAVLGVGALLGPFVAGQAAKWIGWHGALISGFLAKTVATALPTISVSVISVTISSLVVGAMIPAIVALTAGRLAEILGPAGHKRVWGLATAIFAASQAVGGYAMSALYASFDPYAPLFTVGAFFLTFGFLLLSANYLGFREPSLIGKN